jgi:hypothetical protein
VPHDRGVQTIAGLVGAIIGGILVLLGDIVRRRAETRRAEVGRLAEAAANLAAVYGRVVGELRDAHERGLRTANAFAVRPQRYEMGARFFMTPGAEELRPSAVRLIMAYQGLAREPSEMPRSDESYQQYLEAEKAFAADVRTIVRRGRISHR